MRKQPLLILVLCFIIGIIFQDYFPLHFYGIMGVLGISFLILVISFQLNFEKYKFLPILCFYVSLGMFFHFFNTPKEPQINILNSEELVFKISKKLNSNDQNRRYEIETLNSNNGIKAILYVPKDFPELDFKHFYKTNANILKVQSPVHSFQFDYAKYLARKGIFYSVFLKDAPETTENPNVSFADYYKQKRLEVLQRIDQSNLSENTQDFLKGIILADRSDMNQDLVKDFNRSGLTHFLAISGTHVLVIFGMFLFLFQKIFSFRNYKIAVLISLLLIWLFAFFIGWGSSVVRSCIMVTSYFIFVLLQRSPNLLHSLSLSVFIILMFDTQQIFDIGFQLSFSAVLGIYWLNTPIKSLFPDFRNWWAKLFVSISSLTLAAQLSTLPIVLYNFHQFSLMSILANLLIVPFSEIVIVFSFLMTFLLGLNIEILLLNLLYDFIVGVLLKVIHWFSDFDSMFFSSIPMNVLEVFSFVVIVYFLRFFLLKSSFKNVSRLVLSFLIFFSVRLGSNMLEFSKSEVNIYQSSYKKKILVVREGRNVTFWLENINDKKSENYFINPYIHSNRITNYQIKEIPKGSVSAYYNKKTYFLK